MKINLTRLLQGLANGWHKSLVERNKADIVIDAMFFVETATEHNDLVGITAPVHWALRENGTTLKPELEEALENYPHPKAVLRLSDVRKTGTFLTAECEIVSVRAEAKTQTELALEDCRIRE